MNISRRKFVKSTSLAVGSGMLGAPLLSRAGRPISAADTVNLGIIGTGSRGSGLASIAKNTDGVKIAGCCDILPFRLEETIKEHAPEATGYDDYRKLLENQDIDAVIIATPLYMHTPVVLAALDAGKHVYCEKTMTFSPEETTQVHAAASNTDLIFQVGYQQRFNPLYIRIRDTIQKGYLGDLTHVICHWHRNGNWRRQVPEEKYERTINWRMYQEYSGGLMAELISHQLDILHLVAGEANPLKVTGMGGVDYWKDGRDTMDNVFVIYEYPKGMKAQFSSVTTNAHERITLKFYGPKGTIEVVNNWEKEAYFYPETSQLVTQEDQKTIVDGVSGATPNTYSKGEAVSIKANYWGTPSDLAIQSFAESIVNNRQPLSNVHTGGVTANAVHMGNKAIRNGTVETWKPEYSNT